MSQSCKRCRRNFRGSIISKYLIQLFNDNNYIVFIIPREIFLNPLRSYYQDFVIKMKLRLLLLHLQNRLPFLKWVNKVNKISKGRFAVIKWSTEEIKGDKLLCV